MINHPNRGAREQDEADKALLRQQFRKWKAEQDLTASEIAQLLLMPKGTVEQILQRGEFKYPELLRRALDLTEPPK